MNLLAFNELSSQSWSTWTRICKCLDGISFTPIKRPRIQSPQPMPPTLTSWLQFFCVCNCPWSPWKTRVSVQPSLLPGAGSSTQAHVPLPHSKPFAHQLMDRRPNLVLVRFFSTLNAGKPHAVTPQWKSLEIECQKILPYTRRCSPRVHHCYVSYLLFPEGCNEIKNEGD